MTDQLEKQKTVTQKTMQVDLCNSARGHSVIHRVWREGLGTGCGGRGWVQGVEEGAGYIGWWEGLGTGCGGRGWGYLAAVLALLPKTLQIQVKKSEMKAGIVHKMSEDGMTISRTPPISYHRPTLHLLPLPHPLPPPTVPPSTSSHCPTSTSSHCPTLHLLPLSHPPPPPTVPPSAEYYTHVDNFRKDMLQQKMVGSEKSHACHMTVT